MYFVVNVSPRKEKKVVEQVNRWRKAIFIEIYKTRLGRNPEAGFSYINNLYKGNLFLIFLRKR